MLTRMTPLGRITFTDDMQFFPKAQTLVSQHLHKAVETPIIIHHAVANAPLGFLFGRLILFLRKDHLPKGVITNHHGSFSHLSATPCKKCSGCVLQLLCAQQ